MVKKRRRNVIKKLPAGRARGTDGHVVTAIGRSTRMSSNDETEIALDNETRSYMRLWRAVLAQAVQDAKSRRTKAEYDYIRHSALNWLLGSPKDFNAVCRFAGYEPDYVRRCVRAAQQRGFLHDRSPKPQPTKYERAARRDELLEQSVGRRKKGRKRQGFVTRWVQLEMF